MTSAGKERKEVEGNRVVERATGVARWGKLAKALEAALAKHDEFLQVVNGARMG